MTETGELCIYYVTTVQNFINTAQYLNQREYASLKIKASIAVSMAEIRHPYYLFVRKFECVCVCLEKECSCVHTVSKEEKNISYSLSFLLSLLYTATIKPSLFQYHYCAFTISPFHSLTHSLILRIIHSSKLYTFYK